MKLLLNALIKFICGLLLVGLLIFLPAGTFNYIGGWTFLGLLFVPIFVMGIVLLLKAPDLLKKRLDGKEKENTQKSVVAFSALIFITGFVIAGLDFRFGWSNVPTTVVIIASVLFLVAYGLYAEVMRENAYLSRTIEVQENQKVIDTGLYSVVRHPMYMATILLFLMIPIILGSWYAFIIFLAYPIIIALRIKNEEQVLTEQLDGYAEYKQKVKYRIIPFVW
ncbi:MAG: isoprenylcysteine carboxylmethyltransferase family protein [Clostridia bacterium]|nr:isoprenylcysteine carboxylmethyltransferase family protein [Clostridia bacterium]MBQ8794189.1 isoprenylcysteine carboxylmethyltransferase family protein [Clostridia bacterium]